MSKGVPTAIVHKAEIINRLSAGETATDIAKSLGLASHSAISNYLKDDPEYLDARAAFHVSRLDNVEGEIREASDMLTLARTRELATMYRWRAERECRDIYGKSEAPTVSVNLNISSPTSDRLGKILDGVPSLLESKPPLDE